MATVFWPTRYVRSVKAVQKESEWLRRKGFVKEMSFKSGMKGQGSDRWWQRRWWLWYARDEVNQEDSEQNEVDQVKKGADSTGKVMHI